MDLCQKYLLKALIKQGPRIFQKGKWIGGHEPRTNQSESQVNVFLGLVFFSVAV